MARPVVIRNGVAPTTARAPHRLLSASSRSRLDANTTQLPSGENATCVSRTGGAVAASASRGGGNSSASRSPEASSTTSWPPRRPLSLTTMVAASGGCGWSIGAG
jgi:hypothetical protein